MDDRELEVLLRDIESDRVERTISTTDGEKFRQAICAFANDLPNHQKPGVLFIGVHNDGSCANLAITDELLLNLASMRSDGNITPFPTMAVQKRVLNRRELAVVTVEPADAPPVRYRGRVWIRVGPRKAIATVEEERRLTEKRRSKDIPFDIQPVTLATVTDLDVELFRRVYLPSALPVDILEQNQRKEPRQFLPGAYVQFLRFDGADLTDPIKDQKEIDGPLPDLLRVLDETLLVHIAVASDLTTQPTEIRHPEYPIVALQQLVRNAVLHRTYEGTNTPVRISWFNDRIEIQNPGGPFGQVTRQSFGQSGVTDYRNPHIAEVMKNLGYVQRFGIGIQVARKELEKNNNPSPEFVTEASHVLAIIRKRP